MACRDDAEQHPPPRDLRVLQIHTRYRQSGGEDTVVATEAELLRRAGHEVRQVVFENPESHVRSAAALAVAPYNLSSAAVMTDLLQQSPFDVVHVHNTWFALSPSVVAVAARFNAAVVMTLHNYRLACAKATFFRDGGPCYDCLTGSAWAGVVHRCYRDSVMQSAVAAGTIALHRELDTWARSVDRFVAPSTCVRDRMVESGLVPAEKAVVKPHVVAALGDVPTARPAESRRLLFVGRVCHEKGVDLLVDSWARAGVEDLELVIVGDGPLLEPLVTRAPAGVRFLGEQPRERVAALMASARALLFPSVWEEPFGNVVLEAMSRGLPVISSDRGGPVDILARGGGELIPAGDVQAWSDSIRRLATREDLEAIGHRALTVFSDAYAMANGLAPLIDVYREAIDERQRILRTTRHLPHRGTTRASGGARHP